MIILLSPAKSLDYDSSYPQVTKSTISFPEKTQKLVEYLKEMDSSALQSLMHISPKIADLNQLRYAQYEFPFPSDQSRPCIFAFTGDVYKGLDPQSLSSSVLTELNSTVRILSGLYGVLKPFDSMYPYRLEMGTRMAVGSHKNLYQFWGDDIANSIQKDLDVQENPFVLNLASKEYSKAVNFKALSAPVIQVDFKEWRKDVLKVISFSAKKARGRMARLILEEGITDLEGLKTLNVHDYLYSEELSKSNHLVFVK